MEALNGMLLNCHMCQFPIFGHKEKHPNSAKRVFSYKRLTFEEFLICIIYLKKVDRSTVLFAISFPKIDKDLKTGF